MDPFMAASTGTSLVNAAAGILLAALVLVATPRRVPHLALAAFTLSAAGNAVASAVLEIATDPWLAYQGAFYAGLSLAAITVFYAIFIGAAIPSPLAAPLRSHMALAVLVGGLAVLLAVAFLWPTTVVATREGDPGPLWTLAASANAVVLAWALLASLDALRRAPPASAVRARARTYAIAFGIQDGSVLLAAALKTFWPTPGVVTSADILLSIGVTTAFGFVARAMIREHLFDADLKLKTGVRRGTLTAIFLGAFFVVAAVAEQYLQQFGVLLGGIAVGILLLALRPLERLAARLADTAMPAVQDTAEYRTVRKREVYRAAVEGAMQDGAISEKERDVLARVADQLGLTVAETVAIEREARGAGASA